MQKARLENWYWWAPDRIAGNVFGHSRFRDGEEVVSSRIIRHIDSIVETKTTVYILGKKKESKT